MLLLSLELSGWRRLFAQRAGSGGGFELRTAAQRHRSALIGPESELSTVVRRCSTSSTKSGASLNWHLKALRSSIFTEDSQG